MAGTGNVSDSLYKNLLEKIASGEYKEGERLPSENQLKSEFGVSRNTLRTVLSRLNADGILETRRGSGTFVKEGTNIDAYRAFLPPILQASANLTEIVELRRSIEISTAYAAAVCATEQDIEAMEKYYKRLESFDSCDPTKFAELTIDFHMTIAYASHNSLLIKLMEIIKTISTDQMAAHLYYNGIDEKSNYYHKMILLAIRGRMPEEAAYLMEHHMQRMLGQVYRYVENTQEKKAGRSQTLGR